MSQYLHLRTLHLHGAGTIYLIEDGCLLGYYAVQFGRNLQAFLRCLLPPSSGRLIAKTMEAASISETPEEF
jgi:hypothetical protein